MANYIQIAFTNISAEQTELLVAQLSNIGFEGFEEGENSLNAFIPANDFDGNAVKEIAAKNNLSFTRTLIEETNWNALWESNFQPVIVDDFVAIRAHFHKPIPGVEHEIVITPKMSFGTGHHATTYMMIREMRKIDFTGKTVFDFGTGTGILSILAEKLGAEKIVAVDNDDWSIANTAENLEKNDCSKVELRKSGTITTSEHYGIIVANINKNVIMDNFSSMIGQLSTRGTLLLSGLLEEDEKDILAEAGKFTLVYRGKTTKDNWISIRFTH